MTTYFYDEDIGYDDSTWFYDGEYTPPENPNVKKRRGIVAPSTKKRIEKNPYMDLTLQMSLAEVNGISRDGDVSVLKFVGENQKIVVLMQKIYKFNYKPLTYAELLENKSPTIESVGIEFLPKSEILITSVSLIKEHNVEPRIIVKA